MGSIDPSAIWDFTRALQTKQKQVSNTRLASVTRIEDGIVWVSIPGGEVETPTENTNADVSVGDTVTVEWRANKLYILGNSSTPATSMQAVDERLNPILENIESVGQIAYDAENVSKIAEKIAGEAAEVANATGQHFWYDDNGAHVTDAAQEAWTAEYSKANHGELENPPEGKPWYNQLIGSMGTLIRSGLKNLVSLTRSAIAFYDGNGNAETNIVARFGADGAQIGKTSSNHITITANGLGIYSGDTYANVNGVDVGQAASNAATAKSDAATAKSDAASAKTTANTANTTANTAKSTADTAKSTADTAKSTADTAKTTADNAKTAADEAKSVANATKQNFWADTSGVHVSTQANTAAGTFNSLFNANGLLFRKASNNLLSLTGSALNFYDGSGNAAANVAASFGASSARIGKLASGISNLYLASTGMQIRDNATAQGRFLINQSVSGWVDWYGTATAPLSNVCQIDGGSATAPLNFAGNLSFNNGKVRIYSSGQIAVNTMRCFDYLGFRVNANTNSYALKEILKTEYYGTETATGSDGIEIATPNSQWSSPIIKTSPGDKNGQAVLLGGGALTIVGSGEFPTNFFNTRTFAATSETLHLGSDGATYIYTNGNTIANRKTYAFSTAGNLTLPQKQSSIVYTGSTLTETTPSSNQYPGGLYVRDNSESQFAYVRGLHQTNGNRGIQVEARRSVSGSYKYNTLNLTIDTSGDAVVGLGGTNVASAWRNALGASSGVWTAAMIPNLAASKITSGTIARARIENTAWAYLYGAAGDTDKYVRWRMVAGIVFVELRYTSGAGVTTSGTDFGTIPSGYRPSKSITMPCIVANNNVGYVHIATNGKIQVTTRASSNSASAYGAVSYPLG